MPLIYKHWKTVVTRHVSTSKMHEFSHFGLKRLAKKSGGGESYIYLLWGETMNKLSQMGEIRRALPRMLASYDQVYNLQASTVVLCTAGAHPEDPLPLLPFPSLTCGFPLS